MKFDFTLPILELNVNGEFEVTPWALTVTEFKGIYDADDRKDKKLAVAILTYIAILEDYSLWGLKIPEDKMHDYARRNSGIDRIKKQWTPHNSIRKARDKYRELQGYVCVEMQMLFSVEKAIQNLTRMIIRIMNDTDKILNKTQLNEGDVEETMELIDSLLTKTDKLSDRLDTVKKLQEKVAAQRRYEQMKKIRGGGQAGPKENSEDSIIIKEKNVKA